MLSSRASPPSLLRTRRQPRCWLRARAQRKSSLCLVALLVTLAVLAFYFHSASVPAAPSQIAQPSPASDESPAAQRHRSLVEHTAQLQARRQAAASDAEGAQRHPPLQNVVIITAGLEGAVLGGGIGTAYSALSRTPAAAGHSVQVLYVPYPTAHASASSSFALVNYTELGRLYAAAAPASISIDQLLVSRHSAAISSLLPPPPGLQEEAGVAEKTVRGCASYACARSWHVYRWLTAHLRTIDDAPQRGVVVHTQDNAGLGFFASQAHVQRLLPAPITLVLGSHAPHLWQRLANGATAAELSSEDAELDGMERATAAVTDWLVSPSRYMLRWMEDEQGWTLPPLVAVQANLLPQSPTAEQVERRARHIQLGASSESTTPPLSEIVFFGRLELRKGLFLFLDALQLLADNDDEYVWLLFANSLLISFLGPDTRSDGGEWTSQIVRDRCDALRQQLSDRLVLQCELRTNLSRHDSLAHLNRFPQPPPLVVIGSPVDNSPYTVLECLTLGVPFLAADAGGIPELVHRDMQPHEAQQRLFEPTAQHLADKLREAASAGVRWAPMVSRAADEQAWREWHRALPPAAFDSSAPAPADEVSPPSLAVCITYPGSLTRWREAQRAVLEQHVSGNYDLQLVVVRQREELHSLADIARDENSDSSLHSELVAVSSSGWHTRLLSASAAEWRESGGFHRWLAARVTSEYYLLLDHRHMLYTRSAVELLMREAVRSGADVIGAAIHDSAHGHALIDSSCSRRAIPSSSPLANRSLLMRRAALHSTIDDERASGSELSSELNGVRLSNACVPEPLFATRTE